MGQCRLAIAGVLRPCWGNGGLSAGCELAAGSTPPAGRGHAPGLRLAFFGEWHRLLGVMQPVPDGLREGFEQAACCLAPMRRGVTPASLRAAPAPRCGCTCGH
eukprot:13101375-Alexandrium_andersonii.AAC.1